MTAQANREHIREETAGFDVMVMGEDGKAYRPKITARSNEKTRTIESYSIHSGETLNTKHPA